MSPGTRWPYRVDATRWDSDLSAPGADHTGGEFLLYEQRPRARPAAGRGSGPRHG
jgi:hypothetical protein